MISNISKSSFIGLIFFVYLAYSCRILCFANIYFEKTAKIERQKKYCAYSIANIFIDFKNIYFCFLHFYFYFLVYILCLKFYNI